jgi:hypothetical protein
VDRLEKPDRLIFDLDPDAGLVWDRAVAAALTVRDTLQSLGLRSFAQDDWRWIRGKGLPRLGSKPIKFLEA